MRIVHSPVNYRVRGCQPSSNSVPSARSFTDACIRAAGPYSCPRLPWAGADAAATGVRGSSCEGVSVDSPTERRRADDRGANGMIERCSSAASTSVAGTPSLSCCTGRHPLLQGRCRATVLAIVHDTTTATTPSPSIPIAATPPTRAGRLRSYSASCTRGRAVQESDLLSFVRLSALGHLPCNDERDVGARGK